jgi:HEAT repeats/PBS lyase HEAT-like repeat
MRKAILNAAIALTAILMIPELLAAQSAESIAPRVENARLEKRALSGRLPTEVKQWTEQSSQPQWLGYAVPRIAGDRTICCGDYGNSWDNNGCGTCRLESSHNENNVTSKEPDTVRLEGPHYLVVLLRADTKRITKIRVASEDCTLDAGGLPFLWLAGVKPSESVELLTAFVASKDFDSTDEKRTSHGALTALAMHADPAADRALESFVQASQPDSLRRQTAFWLGEARGAVGLRVLQQMAKSDPSSDVRAHVTFALSVSREPGALEEMIRMAHTDESAHVRGQALFWLAHKAGQKAVGAITGAIADDPDTEVKKKAVFALSQLPKDEGVPKLIEVAQNNRNREVRKQAMFWLGQSNDPRALAFFEQVLAH